MHVPADIPQQIISPRGQYPQDSYNLSCEIKATEVVC